MTQQLEERHKMVINEKANFKPYINLLPTNIPEIILLFDMEGKAVLASDSYKRRSKRYSAEEIYGKTFNELFSSILTKDFLYNMNCLFVDALINKQAGKTEQNVDFGKDGNERSYIIHVTPVLHENQTIMGSMVVFQDTTEIIQAWKEAERARALAEQSACAKSELLSRLSHETSASMNAIISMAAIGRRSDDHERQGMCLDKINKASQHLLGIINSILNASGQE